MTSTTAKKGREFYVHEGWREISIIKAIIYQNTNFTNVTRNTILSRIYNEVLFHTQSNSHSGSNHISNHGSKISLVNYFTFS